ncbi:MAG: DUF3306 domain-containing protein [Hyphomicrobiaceae bacterium]
MSTSSDESFLARWSRMKRQPAVADADDVRAEELSPPNDEARSPTECSDSYPAGEASPRAGADAEVEGAGFVAETKVRDFSDFDFEQLNFNSDYTQFMKDDVPEEARKKALRQLWNSNPVLANMDGLDDYCEDYTDAAMVPVGGIRTAYKIGKGFLSDAEVAEWEALGQPDRTETAVAGDGGEGAERSESEDAGIAVAEGQSDTSGGSDEHVAALTGEPGSEDGDAAAGGAFMDSGGCSGAGCAAAVKQEERAALDAYDAEITGTEPGAQMEHAARSRPSPAADKDRTAT